MRREVVDRRLRRFRDAFHEFFLCDAPPAFALVRVDHALADAAVHTADADVLVRAAEAAHRVAFEMRQNEERVIARHVVADGHFRICPCARQMERNGRRPSRRQDSHVPLSNLSFLQIHAMCSRTALTIRSSPFWRMARGIARLRRMKPCALSTKRASPPSRRTPALFAMKSGMFSTSPR